MQKETVTGNAGTILEKHLNLSKAKDAEFSVGSPSYWRKYLYNTSEYIFLEAVVQELAHSQLDSHLTTATPFADGGWDQDAEGIIFNSSGKQDLVLSGGLNYGGKTDLTTTGALDSGLDDLIGGYGEFENDTTVDVDFLLMGSGKYGQDRTRALAEKINFSCRTQKRCSCIHLTIKRSYSIRYSLMIQQSQFTVIQQ